MSNANIIGLSPILLNINNQTTTNANIYTYNFPSGSVEFKNSKLAIQQIIIPYSFYNITQIFNNQKFNIIFPDGSSTVTINFTISPGFYLISDINNYIQSICIANNYYLVNSSGNNVYYIQLTVNSNLDYCQLNCFDVPTSLPSGYTYGSGSTWGTNGLPSTSNQVPQLVVLSNNFTNIIGFKAGTYPATATQSSTYSVSSTFTPQASPVASITVACNLINNLLATPSNLVTTIPITATFASQIIYQPTSQVYLSILDGRYNSLSVSFFDQNNNALQLIDPNCIINLLILKT